MQSAKICNINFFTASLAWASSADHRFCGPRLFPGRHHTVTLSRPRQRRAAHRRSALQYRKFLFFSENFHGGCRAERRSAGPNRIRPNYGPNNVRAKACHGHPARARAWPGWPWHAASCGSAALQCNTVNSCFFSKHFGARRRGWACPPLMVVSTVGAGRASPAPTNLVAAPPCCATRCGRVLPLGLA
jgi:hypothetical protein